MRANGENKMNVRFIAEIGMNHNGNHDLIPALIKSAAESGADYAKFQVGWREGADEINNLSDATLENIVRLCKFYDVAPLFSTITERAFDRVSKLGLRTIKVASRTVKHESDLVRRIVDYADEAIISLGMWDGAEVPFKSANIKYLFCISKYPAYPWDLTGFPTSFGDREKYYGYSDHTVGVEACLIAIARGARIVEKHFTLDKSDTTIRDHSLSATPSEFRTLVTLGRTISNTLSHLK